MVNLISYDEGGDQLGHVSGKTFGRIVAKNEDKLPVLKFGSKRLIDQADLDEFIATLKIQPAPAPAAGQQNGETS